MLCGSGLLTLNDAVMKWVTASYPVGQALFVRGLVVLALLTLAARVSRTRIAASSLTGVALWSAMFVASTFLFIASLRYLPLADATALTFAGPLFVTVLAGRVLGEVVGWHRRAAVAVGFAGVLLILRPGGDAFRWVALMPLGVALIEALRDMLARRLVPHESTLVMVLASTSMVTLAGLSTAVLGWPALGARDAALLALAGCLLGAALWLITESFRFAEASVISPFRYASVIWALALGATVWHDRPDVFMIAGCSLVVAGGLYILRRETRRED